MTDTLFDLPPLPAPDTLSPTQKITLRNQQALDNEQHPATGLPLDHTRTCGDCLYHRAFSTNSRTYHKCEHHRLGLSHSAASDIRLSWPACERFSPIAAARICDECGGDGWVALPPLMKRASGATRERCKPCNTRGLVPR